MIKIGQIIDKNTSGIQYLETFKKELINSIITSGSHIFLAEVLEINEQGLPVKFIESKELEINLNSLNGKSIRDIFTETI